MIVVIWLGIRFLDSSAHWIHIFFHYLEVTFDNVSCIFESYDPLYHHHYNNKINYNLVFLFLRLTSGLHLVVNRLYVMFSVDFNTDTPVFLHQEKN